MAHNEVRNLTAIASSGSGSDWLINFTAGTNNGINCATRLAQKDAGDE